MNSITKIVVKCGLLLPTHIFLWTAGVPARGVWCEQTPRPPGGWSYQGWGRTDHG